MYPEQQYQQPRSRRVPPPLLIVSAVLALALVLAGAIVLTTLGRLHGDIGDEQSRRAARQRDAAAAQSRLRDEFQQAGLAALLTQVRDLTSAAQQKLIDWNALPDDRRNAEIHTVQDAVDRCDLAVFDYDGAAARFPAAMVQAAGLPLAIDTSDTATDCGRIS